MKTKFSFLMICMFTAIITLNAQGGGQPRTVEELPDRRRLLRGDDRS